MKVTANASGIIRIIAGWLLFLFGWGVLFWLHTFRDSLAHTAILPLFFLLWTGFLALVWGGCRTVAPRWGHGWVALQAAASVWLSVKLFECLIGQAL